MTSQNLFTQSSLNENTTLGILTNREEKKKLIDDIENLKTLRAKINQSLEYYKAVRLFPEKNFVKYEEKSVRNLRKVPDAIGILKEELYRYSGIYCSKCELDKEYRFEFNSCKNGPRKETYFVQIVTEEEKRKLGFWKMPVLLDVNEILSKCPIEDTRQVKNFVRLCKYYLDCQENRKTQFENLQTYIGELHKCSLQANLEIYTNIQLQIFMLREIETVKYYDIVLYMVYELIECRPRKLITDSLHEGTLPEDVIRKLKKFFKNFKLLELKPAFEKIVNDENGELFQWEKSFKNKDIVITESDEEDSDFTSQEEGNGLELSEMRSLPEEKRSKEGDQQSEEDIEEKSERLKKNAFEKNNKKEKPSLRKKILKKVTIDKTLENSQSEADKKGDVEENSKKTRRTKKVLKIRFEGEKENQLDETNEEEELKNRQIRKKIPRKIKAKVFKTPKILGTQTKQHFLRQNINIEQTEELEEKEDEEKIHEETKQTQNPKNNRKPLQRNRSKNKIGNKENDMTEIEKLPHETQNWEENSNQQNENPKIEILEPEVQNVNSTIIQEMSTEESNKGRETSIVKEKGTKKKKLKVTENKSIKKTFDLSNFILKRKKPATSSHNVNFLQPIALEKNVAKSSTPIPGREQIHPQILNEISEIIKVNKPIHKSPAKRPRSDSSDSDLDEVVEEPDQSLLKNLEEIQKNVFQSSVENDNKKGKKPSKRVKKGKKKGRKF